MDKSPMRKLKDKYGKNLKSSEALNRAIRAEIEHGPALLDAIWATNRALQTFAPTRKQEAIQTAHDILREEIKRCQNMILDKYSGDDTPSQEKLQNDVQGQESKPKNCDNE